MKKLNLKNKKIILIIIAVVILISTGIFVISYNKIFNPENNNQQEQEIDFRNSKEKEYIENEYKNIDTSDWITYKDPEFGFEFKYPADLKIENFGYEYEGLYDYEGPFKGKQIRSYGLYISNYFSNEAQPADNAFSAELSFSYPSTAKKHETLASVYEGKAGGVIAYETIIRNKIFTNIYNFASDDDKCGFCFKNMTSQSFEYHYPETGWLFAVRYNEYFKNKRVSKKHRMTLFRAIAETLKLPDSIPEPKAIVVE